MSQRILVTILEQSTKIPRVLVLSFRLWRRHSPLDAPPVRLRSSSLPQPKILRRSLSLFLCIALMLFLLCFTLSSPALAESTDPLPDPTPIVTPEPEPDPTPEPTPEPTPLPLTGYRIGIDPGHQASYNLAKEPVSPGSSKKKYKMAAGTSGVKTHVAEHVQNLRIGLKLHDALTALGAEVIMTRRTAKVNISNVRRAKMMNEAKVDLVLRLHCNSSNYRYVTGIEIYYSPIGRAAKDSKRAAALLVPALKRTTGQKKAKAVRSREYSGLNWSTVPSVLIEMGYMSNPTEDKRLNSASYQDKLIQGMVNGTASFLGVWLK